MNLDKLNTVLADIEKELLMRQMDVEDEYDYDDGDEYDDSDEA